MIKDKREFLLDDTIAAISTPLGEGGISIIRLSGKGSHKIAKRLFRRGKEPKKAAVLKALSPSHLYYGHIIDPKSVSSIDEVLIVYMKTPKSYTREDVVEINCHGGILSSRRILDAVLGEGARLAAPGEFTKRAFLNGRIDLTQAESVIDIIRAKTERSMLFASHQLEGEFSGEIRGIKEELTRMLAYFQAYIDFPEDDTDIKYDDYIPTLDNIKSKIRGFLLTHDEGKIFRYGISTAIVGKPNVGKSSLLNVLLKEERAIVTEIPGTTRDIIEEVVNIKGIPLQLIDTAGIRESKCVIESVGIKKTKEKIKHADFVLFVLDAGSAIDDDDNEIYRLISGKKSLVVVNKIDLARDQEELARSMDAVFSKSNIAYISVKKRKNIDQLRNLIFESVVNKKVEQEKEVFLINSRHKDILKRTHSFVEKIHKGLKNKVFPELVCVHIADALETLGEVLGETTSEDILNMIFREFCIGK